MHDLRTERPSQYDRMTSEPVGSLLFRLSVPAVLGMMVTTLYNLVDTAFVGMLGTSRSGATGIVFGFMAILQAVAFMCGHGAGSILSRRLGERNNDAATVYASTGFFLSFVLGAAIGAGTFPLMDPLLTLLGSTPTIQPYARTYITYIAAAAPFFTASLSLNNILRYEGRAKLGTVGMMAGAAVNIGLDALLMYGFGLGIAGAGIATAISQVLSFCILLWMFFSGKTQTKIGLKYVSRRFSVYRDIITTGLPSLLRQGLNSISTTLLNRCAGVYGDAAIAAMSAVSRVSFFSSAVAIGIGQGFQPISSYNYGAGRKDRVRRAFWTGIWSEEIVMLLMGIPMYLFAPQLIRMMRDDPAVVEIGTAALRLMCIAQLFVPLTMMTEMGFQSIGARLWASVGSTLRNGTLFIPSLLILSALRGLTGICEAQPLSIVLAFFVGIFLCVVFLKKLRQDPPSARQKPH